MTFDPKNREHKKQLYSALTEAAKLSGRYFDDFLQIPFKDPWNLAPGYRRNLQRGEYSSIRAKVLYDFILKHHFQTGHEKAPGIIRETVGMRWRAILAERATKGQLKVTAIKHRIGVAQRASKIATADVSIKLGQYFCLGMTAKQPGYAVVLQGLNNNWHAIEIGQDGGYVCQIGAGENLMPRLDNGLLDPLSENEAAGLYDFVLVFSASQSPPVTIDDLIKWVNAYECDIHRVRVDFK